MNREGQKMGRNLRAVAAAGTLLITIVGAGPALAQKSGGVLKIYHRDSPASMSILEEATNSTEIPMMGVFNNLVLYKQDVPQNSLQSIVPDLATNWSWNEDGTELTFRLRSGDGYHAISTHYRYFVQYLHDLGADTARWTGPRRQWGIGMALGGGHSVIENPQRPTPIMMQAKDELAAIRARLVEKFGAEHAARIADFNRNLFIFPNLILISNWHTIRTWYPLAPDYIEIDAWAALPRDDSPELRQKRYENFISFLGPAGFGTPDDVSGLEGCQRGFATWRELPWSDISRGMGRDQPTSQDELQMRAFWRRWNALMHGERGPTDCSDRPPPQRAAAE